MKKLLSFALLAALLSFASFAQAATIAPTITYDFSTSFKWSEEPNPYLPPQLDGNASGEWTPENGIYSDETFKSTGSMYLSGARDGEINSILTINIGDDKVELSLNYSISYSFIEFMSMSVPVVSISVLDSSVISESKIIGENIYTFDFNYIFDSNYYEENGIWSKFGNKFDLNYTASVTTEPIPNPEPATMLLMGAGLAGLGALKRRRNK